MFRTFALEKPTTLTVDGVRHKLWIMYLGRGRYYPVTTPRWSVPCWTTASWTSG